ncbi:hypothetical protein PD716_03340 [Vibrio gigantis]|uniref:hypothetical protein n=1 Tax=Vibrio gigantis TaxID=296199 RepID=UPI002FC92D03
MRQSSVIVLTVFVFLIAFLMTTVSKADIIVEAQLAPLDNPESAERMLHVYPKQSVRMDVQLGSNVWFTQPPIMPTWEVDGASILKSTQEENGFSFRQDGQTMSGVNRYFWVVPEQVGRIRIASHPVTLFPALSDEPITTELPGMTLYSTLPEGIDDIHSFVPSSLLTMEQMLSEAPLVDDEPREWEVGDEIVRTVNIHADDLMANFIPLPVVLNGDAEQQVIQSPASYENRTKDRGEFIGGTLTVQYRYLLTNDGEVTLPALEAQWWDTHEQISKTVQLPEQVITVLPASRRGAEQLLNPTQWLVSLPIILISMVMALVATWVKRREVLYWLSNGRIKLQQRVEIIRLSQVGVLCKLLWLIVLKQKSYKQFYHWQRESLVTMSERDQSVIEQWQKAEHDKEQTESPKRYELFRVVLVRLGGVFWQSFLTRFVIDLPKP